MTGTFVAVVGPSGVGKDTVLDGVRARLSGDPRFVFVRRVITRASGGNEDHDTIDPDAFDRAVAEGAFALSWKAHGLGYGIPARYRDDVDAGRVVVANLSREAIGTARRVFGRTAVLSITAPRAVIAGRLAARGRETAAEIEARLARAPAGPSGADVVEIDNGGALEDAVDRAVHALRDLASGGSAAQ